MSLTAYVLFQIILLSKQKLYQLIKENTATDYFPVLIIYSLLNHKLLRFEIKIYAKNITPCSPQFNLRFLKFIPSLNIEFEYKVFIYCLDFNILRMSENSTMHDLYLRLIYICSTYVTM